jgi:hypothetical protein
MFRTLRCSRRENNFSVGTTTTTTTKMASSSISSSSCHLKSLEGIQVNDSLLKHWKDAFDKAATQHEATVEAGSSSISNPLTEAVTVLRTAGDPSHAEGSPMTMPLSVLKAIQVLYQELQQGTHQLVSLEEALHKSSLVFTSPSLTSEESQQHTKFQKRMERLRLQLEETKYSILTDNIQDHRQDDDVTAKSMTFAASVGLNMIIAPLSFGCFMYFFAGGILDYVFTSQDFDQQPHKAGRTDIKRVIVGVVSGVIMMIIEMLLFVIRTHEFEEHNRRKKKKKNGRVEPFGVYSKNTPAVYSDHNSKRQSRANVAPTGIASNDLSKKQK